MADVATVYKQPPDEKMVRYYCAGCKCDHVVRVEGARTPRWTWNGSLEKPSFMPSVLYTAGGNICHTYITDGNVRFLPGCTHELAGQTVPLEPFVQNR
jgi:hypothetical protein